MDTAVYVNSTFVGEWKYGYSTFEFDITPSLREGVNEVSVRIDYRYLNSRWYSGAGISGTCGGSAEAAALLRRTAFILRRWRMPMP